MVYPSEYQATSDFVFNWVATNFLNVTFVLETMIYFNFTLYKN